MARFAARHYTNVPQPYAVIYVTRGDGGSATELTHVQHVDSAPAQAQAELCNRPVFLTSRVDTCRTLLGDASPGPLSPPPLLKDPGEVLDESSIKNHLPVRRAELRAKCWARGCRTNSPYTAVLSPQRSPTCCKTIGSNGGNLNRYLTLT
ncbi:hypothetical protein J6590_006116 [Homalodisca vitripennis]|nr:hypothetical protein J6590_006116 [Homalodisca vitripennis]